MPVGGSRHYGGPGLGEIGIWRCPSCGKDNAGPLPQGCTACGAGKPLPPPDPEPVAPAPKFEPRSTYEYGDQPRVSERRPDDPTYLGPDLLRLWREWDQQNPDATSETAFVAGYLAGLRAQQQRRPPPAPARELHAPEAKTYRTLVAALSYFRDQFLAGQPEEVRTGEWLGYDEASSVITQLQETLTGLRPSERQGEGQAYAIQS